MALEGEREWPLLVRYLNRSALAARQLKCRLLTTTNPSVASAKRAATGKFSDVQPRSHGLFEAASRQAVSRRMITMLFT